MIRIVLIEDHSIVRDGVRALLELRDDFSVVGEASDGISGLDLIRTLAPHAVFVDLNLPALDGVALIAEAKRFSDAKFIVLTSSHDETRARAAIAAGADAFLLKTCSRAELYDAIDHAMLYQEPLIQLVECARSHSQVTAAELRVLRAIRTGKTNEQIAAELCISLNTVKTHITHIFRKLNANNRTNALVKAQTQGLL